MRTRSEVDSSGRQAHCKGIDSSCTWLSCSSSSHLLLLVGRQDEENLPSSIHSSDASQIDETTQSVNAVSGPS